MGYRSEVGVLITLPDNMSVEDMLKDIREAIKGYSLTKEEALNSENKSSYLFDNLKVQDGENKFIQLKSDYIKWYESYDDINKFMRFVHTFEDRYETGGIHFLRIGEDYGDIEELVYGEVLEFLGCARFIEDFIY